MNRKDRRSVMAKLGLRARLELLALDQDKFRTRDVVKLEEYAKEFDAKGCKFAAAGVRIVIGKINNGEDV